jgi:S-adenosylmethionine hydrolase
VTKRGSAPGPPPSGIITLTTDFGLEDAYVAELKAVLLSIFPAARLVDVSHRVAPQDVFGASFLIARAAPWFPAGTVHLAVVDPGVGTRRRALVVRTARATFVGPDNGIFEPVFAGKERAVARGIRDERHLLRGAAATFEGRDRLAPAAAYLARGLDPSVLGPVVAAPVRAPWPRPRRRRGVLEGEVLYVDGFGTLVSNIPAALVQKGDRIEIAGRIIPGLKRAYAEAAPGEAVALAGSAGHLEIAVREGRADVRLPAGRGTRVTVRR